MAIAIVMGTGEAGIPTLIERLTARSWLPSSVDLRSYLIQCMCRHPNVFERRGRAIYRVVQEALGELRICTERWAPDLLVEGKLLRVPRS
jgi:hypothetical protein